MLNIDQLRYDFHEKLRDFFKNHKKFNEDSYIKYIITPKCYLYYYYKYNHMMISRSFWNELAILYGSKDVEYPSLDDELVCLTKRFFEDYFEIKINCLY